jgi:hypothetical protein
MRLEALSHERPESGVKGHDLFLRICEEEKEAQEEASEEGLEEYLER